MAPPDRNQYFQANHLEGSAEAAQTFSLFVSKEAKLMPKTTYTDSTHNTYPTQTNRDKVVVH